MDKRIIMIAALALAAVACGDDEGGGDDDIVIKTDASINNPIDAGPGLDSSTPQPDSSTPTDSGAGGPKGAPGCFSGTPTTSVQFLNACADGYREFDNSKRIPGYVKGQPLPPL